MASVLDQVLDLWQEPIDKRDDPEAAFRELYADPVSINGVPTSVSVLSSGHALYSEALPGSRPRSSTASRLRIGS
jgi:hypothetical protein